MAGGLSTAELATIRDTLAAGRRPRVVFTESAGQIAGQLGQVVALTDPKDSDEWVVVRFGRDELPFAPVDLALAPKGAARRGDAKRVEQPAPPPELKIVRELPSPRQEAVMSSSAPDSVPAAPVEVGRSARKAGRAVKAKPAPGLTVTLAYAEGEWTVAAQQGAKVLAKPYVIKPAEALKMVGLLDVPGVQEAVEQIVAAERAEAEQRAQRLRDELAEIEARLAELREAG
ncbi:MAG TPA: hypothetical protein VF054_15725 [Micromonosporaceae bacterium]